MAPIEHLFSDKDQLIIYRIFQEALANISKHAQASRLSIAVGKNENRCTFLIKDNGRGFDIKRAKGKNFIERGMGLAAMEERARMLEGSLNIWSQVGKGTRINLAVPVNREEIREEEALPDCLGR